MVHLDQKALAKRWPISERTLEQWRWQGKGPPYLKIGGRVLYRLCDVEAFESASLHANTSGPLDFGTEGQPADADGRDDRQGARWAEGGEQLDGSLLRVRRRPAEPVDPRRRSGVRERLPGKPRP
jgi:hypothetical protein